MPLELIAPQTLCESHREPLDERNLCAYCEIEKRIAEQNARVRSIDSIMRAA